MLINKLNLTDKILLDVLANWVEGFGIQNILSKNFCAVFNVPENDQCDPGKLKKTVQNLFQEKLIFCNHKDTIVTEITDSVYENKYATLTLTPEGGKAWENIYEVDWGNCWTNLKFFYNDENDTFSYLYVFYNLNHFHKVKNSILASQNLALLKLDAQDKNYFGYWNKAILEKGMMLKYLEKERMPQHDTFYRNMPKLHWRKDIRDVVNEA